MLKKNGVHYNTDSQSLNPSMIALVSKGWGRLRLHNFPESSLRSESWNFLKSEGRERSREGNRREGEVGRFTFDKQIKYLICRKKTRHL